MDHIHWARLQTLLRPEVFASATAKDCSNRVESSRIYRAHGTRHSGRRAQRSIVQPVLCGPRLQPARPAEARVRTTPCASSLAPTLHASIVTTRQPEFAAPALSRIAPHHAATLHPFPPSPRNVTENNQRAQSVVAGAGLPTGDATGACFCSCMRPRCGGRVARRVRYVVS